jgi:hypothetical protein
MPTKRNRSHIWRTGPDSDTEYDYDNDNDNE